MDGRFKEQNKRLVDRIDRHFDRMDRCGTGQDPKSAGMKEDLHRDRETEALPRQQARPKNEDAYSEESGK